MAFHLFSYMWSWYRKTETFLLDVFKVQSAVFGEHFGLVLKFLTRILIGKETNYIQSHPLVGTGAQQSSHEGRIYIGQFLSFTTFYQLNLSVCSGLKSSGRPLEEIGDEHIPGVHKSWGGGLDILNGNPYRIIPRLRAISKKIISMLARTSRYKMAVNKSLLQSGLYIICLI